MLAHIYEGLVRYDENLQIAPSLATSWEVVSPTLWRFHLREGVTFHDGAPFTAADVLASLTRVSDPASPLRGNLPAYISAEVIDDYTIDVTTTPNYPLLLNDLTNIVIFDNELADRQQRPRRRRTWARASRVTPPATPTAPARSCWSRASPMPRLCSPSTRPGGDERLHNIDTIVFTPISSAATRVAALLSGEIDFTNAAPLQDIPRLQATPDINVLASNELRTVFLPVQPHGHAHRVPA